MEFGEEPAARKTKRLPGTSGGSVVAEPRRPPLVEDGEPAIQRLISPLAMLVVAATVVCCVLGFVLARQADDYLESEHRQALRGAIEALQAVSPELGHIDPKLVRLLERASGFKGLRFDEEGPTADREVQSLVDANGRIIGWFSWESERPATALMFRLLPFGALIAVGLLGFAMLAMWQLRRLGFLLAKSSREVHKLAYEDAVTGLPNLHHLRAFLDRALARRGDGTLAIALLDLGGFDDLKDTVGEAGEDELLNEIADRLSSDLPDGALVARMRGDRFGLVMPTTDAASALATLRAIREAVSRPLWINQVVQVGANVGFAMAPRDGDNREELMRRADLALRTAKRRGRALTVAFSSDMEADFDERRFIRRELSRALAARAFEVHYQPIVKADGGAIVGVEALLRWNHVEPRLDSAGGFRASRRGSRHDGSAR